MEKVFKGKSNFKKILEQNDLIQKYDVKNSQTMSTNESKLLHEIERGNLAASSSQTAYSLMLRNLKSYGTSSDFFYLSSYQQSFNRPRTRQKILLKQSQNYTTSQLLQQFYPSSESFQQLRDLFQYYKYYINNPILYPKEHFKTLYNFYEKKKYLQYKRLKAVLDLDDSKNTDSAGNSVNQNISLQQKRNTKESTQSFYIMKLIQTDLTNQDNPSESKAFLELNDNLQRIFAKFDSSGNLTPEKLSHSKNAEKNNPTLFKKKKPFNSNPSSLKNTVAKKSKKQLSNNSNGSMKKKLPRPFQQPYSSKFLLQNNQTLALKARQENHPKKNRNGSNLSMGDVEIKNHNTSTASPKRRLKKRMNSCETVITGHCSQQKQVLYKKFKKKVEVEMDLYQQKTQERDLQDFKNFLKKNTSIHRRNTQQKVNDLGWDLQRSKIKKQNTPLESQQSLIIKKAKRKVQKTSCGKSSLPKSPNEKTKQNVMEQSIINLKKKIQMAKEAIKASSSNLHLSKKEKFSKIGQK